MGIILENVSYSYQAGTPLEGPALYNVDLEIKSGSYTALVGHTGSGKSTILQLLNGLLTPVEGRVVIDDYQIDAKSKKKDIKQVRKKVGLVFQFPESQLFEETVLSDVAFGPKNFGVSEEDAREKAKEALFKVGITEDLFEKSPFELSGGQMRRVAIAGILAMEPEVLVLDEPTAGLDPLGREELMTLFKDLHHSGLTVVLVTHVMDDVAEYVDYVYVLEQGRIVEQGQPKIVFQDIDKMESFQLGVPKVTLFAHQLKKRGLEISELPIKLEELKEMLHD